MPQIRPITDLRNNFTEISRIVHEDKEPVFLTKNGCGDMVVMSIEDYQDRRFAFDVDVKLLEARGEALSSPERHTHGEVMERMRKIVGNASKEI
jgi:prevent-host-death family protein